MDQTCPFRFEAERELAREVGAEVVGGLGVALREIDGEENSAGNSLGAQGFFWTMEDRCSDQSQW